MFVKGLRPITSGAVRISTANEELVQLPFEGTVKNYRIIEFFAKNDCTLIWNNEREFEVKGGAGIYLDERFVPCESLVIREPNVEFYFTAGF